VHDEHCQQIAVGVAAVAVAVVAAAAAVVVALRVPQPPGVLPVTIPVAVDGAAAGGR
jgi:hypothetical protein